MYITRFAYFEIGYTEKDKECIQLLIKELNNKYLDIMNFFNLTKLKRTVSIKL